MVRAILNRSWKQHAIRPPTSNRPNNTDKKCKTLRSKDELISDVLLWPLSHGHSSVGWPTRTYLQQLCMDMGCSREDLQEIASDQSSRLMIEDDRDEWRKRERERESGKSVRTARLMMMIWYRVFPIILNIHLQLYGNRSWWRKTLNSNL